MSNGHTYDLPRSGYPDSYRDPPWDGTTDAFRNAVIPARVSALEQSFNDALAGLLPDGCRFEYMTEGGSNG